MVVTCEINFKDNPLGTYFAGEIITGSVVLKADKPKLAKSVVLRIEGYATTFWTNSTTDGDNKTTEENFSGHEDYMKSTVELFKPIDGSDVAIQTGTHIYKFACQIPVVCPSSFEGTHGRVRYMVIVKLIRPWRGDQKFSRAFTVLKLMDLNKEGLYLRIPAHSEDQMTYNCWPCRSAPLRLNLSLPQRGFVPGQNIPVGVLVTNDSHIRVEEMNANLIMMVLYYSQGSIKTISERFVVSEKKGDGVSRNSKKEFTFDLYVPATPPTCFDLCRIIQIAYQVEVQAKVKGWHISEKVHLPVTIGNVPLSRLRQQQPRATPIEVEVVAQQLNERALVLIEDGQTLESVLIPASNPWTLDANIPLPSYAQAAHVRLEPIKSTKPASSQRSSNNVDDKSGTLNKDDLDFTPLYAVFNLATQMETSQEQQASSVAGDGTTWF